MGCDFNFLFLELNNARIAKEKDQEAPIYGGIEVPQAVRSLLRNPPKMRVWLTINITQIMMEIEKGCVKRTWEEMGNEARGRKQATREELEKEVEDTKVYDSTTCTVNLH